MVYLSEPGSGLIVVCTEAVAGGEPGQPLPVSVVNHTSAVLVSQKLPDHVHLSILN